MDADNEFKDGRMIERLKLYFRIALLLVGVAFFAEVQADNIVDSIQIFEDN